jgi:AcrR family transcriptional regulator
VQLDRTAVVDAALAILDDYGLGDLTMRRLATSLGVAPGALYWHFPNKQTLLAAVADRVLAGMAGPVGAADWAGRLTELAHRLRDALLAHRDGAELVASAMASRLAGPLVRERFAQTAADAGLDPVRAELTADTLLYYILGHTSDEQSRMHLDSAGALPDTASPLADTGPSPAARFAFGLELLLDGARTRLPVP